MKQLEHHFTEMEFFPLQHQKKLWWGMTFGFLGMAIFSAFAMATDPPKGLPYPPSYSVIFMLCFWGAWFLLSCMMLWGSYHDKVLISRNLVRYHGFFGIKEIQLDAVKNLNWIYASKSVALRDPQTKITIDLSGLPPEEALKLVDFFRTRIAEDRQKNWEDFCFRIAEKWLAPENEGPREPTADEVRITRQSLNKYFIPAAVVVAGLYFPLLFWVPDTHKLNKSYFLIIISMLLKRYLIPKEGMIVKRMTQTDKRHLKIGLVHLIVMFAMIGISEVFFSEEWSICFLLLVGFILFCSMMYLAYTHDRQENHERHQPVFEKWQKRYSKH